MDRERIVSGQIVTSFAFSSAAAADSVFLSALHSEPIVRQSRANCRGSSGQPAVSQIGGVEGCVRGATAIHVELASSFGLPFLFCCLMHISCLIWMFN